MNVLNAAERDHKINQLNREINVIWKSMFLGSVFAIFLWWFFEPTMRKLFDEELFTTILNVFFNYITVPLYLIGNIMAFVAIFKKKGAIRKYKKAKDVPPKINIQKGDLGQNPDYVIDHSKDKSNQYEKGDRDMMKRVFNQNKNVSTNSGNQNTNRTRGKGRSTRSYNGSTRSSNSMESDNSALDIALGSSIYSTGNDNDCSSSSSSNYSSSSSDYSSGSSGYDGGSSCD